MINGQLIRHIVWITVLVRGAASAVPTWAQPEPPPYHKVVHELTSGVHKGSGDKEVSAYKETIRFPDATWLHLHFGEHYLGDASYITITSPADGGMQRLNAATMAEWFDASAVFNGDAVEVELFVAPTDTGVFVTTTAVDVGESLVDKSPGGQKSLCGADDRVASTDNRVGRLYFGGCTTWRISNGALLTAGHCVDFDPDQSGPGLPDGILDLSGVVEFNIPASTSSGGTVAANPNDQYPIIVNSTVWHFEGEGQGLGKDYAVFAVNPNSNTGLLPHEAYGGFFRMTNSNPAVNSTIRITGCGIDNTPPGSTGNRNAQNMTLQTSTGPYVTENVSGANYSHEYQTDTEGANSGSPVIWAGFNSGLTIGIHTNAGCSATNGNSGTSFEHNPLESAIQNFPASPVRYVDDGHPELPYTESGGIYRPYNTVLEAVTAIAAGGMVSIVAGSYPETMTITKAMRIEAPVGSAVIGQ